MKIEFKEEQKFTQWWLWMILIPAGISPIIGIYQQIIIGEPFGDRAMSGISLMVSTIFMFSIIGLFFLLNLKTSIDNDKVEMRFFPFVKKTTKWTDIKKADVVSYGFVGG
jgi:hypothetical protein